MSFGELRVLVAKQLLAWKELCEADTTCGSFSDVGLSVSLKLDGSQDHRMKFQGQSPGKPSGIIMQSILLDLTPGIWLPL